MSGGASSLVTLAVLALGVLLFDAINDALAGGGGGGGRSGGRHQLHQLLLPEDHGGWTSREVPLLGPGGWAASREVLLPGPGRVGEYINSLLEIGLHMITVWMHGEAGTECGRRLLCELNQRARAQSPLHSALTYTGGLLLSLLLPEASAADHLLAMRRGRHGGDCLAAFGRCQVTL